MTSALDKLTSFYANPLLYINEKKLIPEDYKKVFIEGKKAYVEGHAFSENPYQEKDDTYIYSKYDVWNEGWLIQERY